MRGKVGEEEDPKHTQTDKSRARKRTGHRLDNPADGEWRRVSTWEATIGRTICSGNNDRSNSYITLGRFLASRKIYHAEAQIRTALYKFEFWTKILYFYFFKKLLFEKLLTEMLLFFFYREILLFYVHVKYTI